MTKELLELVKKEAEEIYGNLFNAANPTALWNGNELIKHCIDSHLTGATFMHELMEGEVERLKGLIEKAYDYAREHRFTRYPDKIWQQFKTDNNL